MNVREVEQLFTEKAQDLEQNGNGTHNGEGKDTLVVGQTSQGAEVHATLVRMTRHVAVFEIYNPALVWVRNLVTVNEVVSGSRQLMTPGVIDADAMCASSSVFVNGAALSTGIAAGNSPVTACGCINGSSRRS